MPTRDRSGCLTNRSSATRADSCSALPSLEKAGLPSMAAPRPAHLGFALVIRTGGRYNARRVLLVGRNAGHLKRDLPMIRPSRRGSLPTWRRAAFTLVELLVVIAII